MASVGRNGDSFFNRAAVSFGSYNISGDDYRPVFRSGRKSFRAATISGGVRQNSSSEGVVMGVIRYYAYRFRTYYSVFPLSPPSGERVGERGPRKKGNAPPNPRPL